MSGDSSRLQQVVWNLVSNAVKFTPAEGRVEIYLKQVESRAGEDKKGKKDLEDLGEISIQNPKFEIQNLTTHSYAQIQVSDTGKGINPEFLPYVFEYFRQEDGKTTRKFGGLGLGLAIVRHITELHGGTVKAESPGEGQGATFTVSLPLLGSSEQGLESSDTCTIPQLLIASHTPLKQVRVLVVDDEADTRDLAVALLEQYGATVEVAASAAEAFNALDRFKPDVLVSDIGMPDVDGYMLMRQVRQRSRWQNI